MGALHWFLLRILLWLPICFGVWYFLAILFISPLASIVDTLMGWTFSSLIEGVVQRGTELLVTTHLIASVTPGPGAGTGELFLELNPLKYGYCVPLYTALVLAAPGGDAIKIMRWLVGMLVLLAIQVFGISTEILKVLAFQTTEEARAILGFSSWQYDALALAYQLGYLIFPPVAPVVIWFGQFRDALPQVIAKNTSE